MLNELWARIIKPGYSPDSADVLELARLWEGYPLWYSQYKAALNGLRDAPATAIIHLDGEQEIRPQRVAFRPASPNGNATDMADIWVPKGSPIAVPWLRLGVAGAVQHVFSWRSSNHTDGDLFTIKVEYLDFVHHTIEKHLSRVLESRGLDSSALVISGSVCREAVSPLLDAGPLGPVWPDCISDWSKSMHPNLLDAVLTAQRGLIRLRNQIASVGVGSVTTTETTKEDDLEYTPPDSPSRWAKRFNVSPKTFKRYVEGGKIRGIKISDRSYRIAVADLPPK
jgi:hypothetical protein